MTINVVLVTHDALIFGCDSVASTTSFMVDPFRLDLAKDAAGKELVDAKGNFLVGMDFNKAETVVTNAWGGVQKMYSLHGGKTPVVAVTAGLAKFSDGRTIKSLAEEFAETIGARNPAFVRVEVIAKEFLKFFRKAYDRHYKGSTVPEQYRDPLNFLVGGYGKADAFPSLYRVKILENTVTEERSNGATGLVWEGQSDAVERLIRGYDWNLKVAIESYIRDEFAKHHKEMTDAVARIVNDVLAKLGAKMPAGVDTTLPATAKLSVPWDSSKLAIGYSSFTIQDAVRLVAFLVNLQSGRSKFAYGVPTVGGRTRIGVVTKSEGLKMLDEPVLRHTDRGFSDDL